MTELLRGEPTGCGSSRLGVAVFLGISCFVIVLASDSLGFLNLLKNCAEDIDDKDALATTMTQQLEHKDSELLRVAEIAAQRGYECEAQQNTTSLIDTARQIPTVTLSKRYKPTYFVPVDFTFHAYSDTGKPQTIGGDAFVLAFVGWRENQTAFKTAAYAQDFLNGTYRSTLHLPPQIDSFNLTIMHYYTCYEGMVRVWKQRPQFHRVPAMGPLAMQGADEVMQVLAAFTAPSSNYSWKDFQATLPFCEATQEGIDELSQGVWVDENVQEPVDITIDAERFPLYCRPPLMQGANEKLLTEYFRVGDSTMPGYCQGKKAKLEEVGQPYEPWKTDLSAFPNHHKKYTALVQRIFEQENRTVASDPSHILIFNAGLWQIFHGPYNVEASMGLVFREACQLALAFPGKMMLEGPVPIQQSLYPKIDITAQNVQLLNARLRQAIGDADNRLDRICRNRDVDRFVSMPNVITGDVLPWNETMSLSRQKHNYDVMVNETSEGRQLVEWIQPEPV